MSVSDPDPEQRVAEYPDEMLVDELLRSHSHLVICDEHGQADLAVEREYRQLRSELLFRLRAGESQ